MNLALVEGAVTGVGAAPNLLFAAAHRLPGECCVHVAPWPAAG